MEIAPLLHIPISAPVAHVRRVFTDGADRVIYLGQVTYRGDFVHLDMDLMPAEDVVIVSFCGCLRRGGVTRRAAWLRRVARDAARSSH